MSCWPCRPWASAAAICINFSGKQSWKVNYPVVLGHEFAGVIAKKGRQRPRIQGGRPGSERDGRGDLPPTPRYSPQGLYNLDPNRLGFGYGVNGAMTRLSKVPERCLHRIPDRAAIREGGADGAVLRGLQRDLRQLAPAARRHRGGDRARADRAALRGDGEDCRRRASGRSSAFPPMPTGSRSRKADRRGHGAGRTGGKHCRSG